MKVRPNGATCFILITANTPHSNQAICVSAEKCASISTPAQTGAVYDLADGYTMRLATLTAYFNIDNIRTDKYGHHHKN